MNGQNEENLKDLFEKFFNPEQAERAAEDVRKGEQILGEHPAPKPNDELIAGIKSEIAEALLHRKATALRRTAYKAVAVAAVFIILAVVSVKLFEEGGGEPERLVTASIIPKAVWESEDIAADDADLAVLTAEIEQIEGETMALRLGENGGNGNNAITELEIELMEIDSDFWKG